MQENDKCDWGALQSDNSLARLVINTVQKRIGRVTPDEWDNAPYQFALPILFSIYFTIQEKLFQSDSEAKQICQFADTLRANCADDRKGFSDIPYPRTININVARKFPLRGICLFTWEHHRRLFLVRRTYPHCFDLVSYSQCPAGWGSLGRMLSEIERCKNGVKPMFTDSLHHQSPPEQLFPYYGEIKRIGHSAVLCQPVYDTENALRAAFMYFLKDTDQIEPCIVTFQELVKIPFGEISSGVAEVLKTQDKILGRGQLPALWAEWFDKADGTPKPVFAQLMLKSNKKTLSASKRILQAARNIVTKFGETRYYVYLDEEAKLSQGRQQLFLTCPTAKKNDRIELMHFCIRTAMEVCSEFADIEYEFHWWASESVMRKARRMATKHVATKRKTTKDDHCLAPQTAQQIDTAK